MALRCSLKGAWSAICSELSPAAPRCAVLQRATAPPGRCPSRTGPGPLASPNLCLAGIHGHAMQPGSAQGTSCSNISPPRRPAAWRCSALLRRLGGVLRGQVQHPDAPCCVALQRATAPPGRGPSRTGPAPRRALLRGAAARYCAAWEGSFEDRSSTPTRPAAWRCSALLRRLGGVL